MPMQIHTHTGLKKKKKECICKDTVVLSEFSIIGGNTQVAALASCTKFNRVPQTELYLLLFLLNQAPLHFLLSVRPRPPAR